MIHYIKKSENIQIKLSRDASELEKNILHSLSDLLPADITGKRALIYCFSPEDHFHHYEDSLIYTLHFFGCNKVKIDGDARDPKQIDFSPPAKDPNKKLVYCISEATGMTPQEISRWVFNLREQLPQCEVTSIVDALNENWTYPPSDQDSDISEIPPEEGGLKFLLARDFIWMQLADAIVFNLNNPENFKGIAPRIGQSSIAKLIFKKNVLVIINSTTKLAQALKKCFLMGCLTLDEAIERLKKI